MSEQVEEAISLIESNAKSSFAFMLVGRLQGDVNSQLEMAHSRYEHLIGITSGSIDEETVSKDVAEHPDLIKKSESGSIIFDDIECAQFMSTVSGIPSLLCRMYIAHDFIWTAASGFVDNPETEIREMLSEVTTLIKDDDEALTDVIRYLDQHGFPLRKTA